MNHNSKSECVLRFTAIRRAEHAFAILAFLLLVLTGFPQKFHEAPWAAWILDGFGGVDNTRRIHHGTGTLLACHLLLHLSAVLVGVIRGRVRLSLLPVPQDVRDFIVTWKYRFGFSNCPPKYPKFTYQQKFQYLGLLLGGAVMVLSGLILLYPQTAILFAPGHIIPAAREAHSNDALVAYVLLVVWHIYSATLSPDSMPMNTSIFTGYMTKRDLKRRHAGYYENLFENKKQS